MKGFSLVIGLWQEGVACPARCTVPLHLYLTGSLRDLYAGLLEGHALAQRGVHWHKDNTNVPFVILFGETTHEYITVNTGGHSATTHGILMRPTSRPVPQGATKSIHCLSVTRKIHGHAHLLVSQVGWPEGQEAEYYFEYQIPVSVIHVSSVLAAG